MKYRYILILIIAIFTIRCSNIDSHINSNFEIFELDTDLISLDSSGNYDDLNISSNNNWKIDSTPNWIEVSEIKGSGNAILSIGADQNLSIEERSGYIIFSHLQSVDSIYITQDGVEEYIFSVDSQVKTFTNEANEVELLIETDRSWNITTDCDWIEITPSKGEGSSTVKVKASNNELPIARVDSCLISSDIIGVDPLKIRLIQDGSMGSFIKDSLSLVALYSELRDGTLPWDMNSLVSTWEGVTLNLRDGESRVTEINIELETLEEYAGIERTIFIPELFNLKYIELFDIEGLGYDMIGDIPSEISEWQELKYLRLVNTNIREQYTASIKNLKNLENLIIYDTFTSEPYYQTLTEEFSELNKLENLYLGRGISGEVFPEVIFDLENLKSLNLQFYKDIEITTIPDRFNELPNLESLTITFNEPSTLTSLPLSINSCSKLINYSSNFLVDNVSLDDYPFIKNIEFLDISNIDLSSYTLDEIIPYLSNYIQEFNLSGCSITGSVSDDILNLEYLNSLDITNNYLFGTFSDDFSEKVNNLYWSINPQQNGVSLKPDTIDDIIYNELIDERDGNIYRTIVIGEQEWMAENLTYTATIPLSEDWDYLSYTDQAYCYYDNDISLGYGCLYTWAAAMGGLVSSNFNSSSVRGICPSGWHLPSDAEWQELEDYLNDNVSISGGNVAKSMSNKTGWSSYSGTSTTNNSSGFSALPGGWRTNYMGLCYSAGYFGYWWTSTPALSYSAYTRRLSSGSQDIVREVDGGIKDGGFSVRCLRDYQVEVIDIVDLVIKSSPNKLSYSVDEALALEGLVVTVSYNDGTTYDITYLDFSSFGLYISIENGAALSVLDSNIIISNSDGSISVDQIIAVTSSTSEPIYGDMTDSRDGKSYKTVQIGGQEWMAENLTYTGTIPLSEDWDYLSYTDQAYCYYDNDISLGYGCLYTWAAAMGGLVSSNFNSSSVRGICPSGWHLPSDAEWQELEDYLNDNVPISGGNVAKSMSNKTGWSSYSGTSTTNNSSGFSALPGGWRTNHMGLCYSAGYFGYWWTSTPALSYSAYTRRLSSGSQDIVREVDGGIKDGGFSVRCLKDSQVEAIYIEDLTIKSSPNSIDYFIGNPLSLEGLIVTVSYNDDTTYDITYLDFSSFGLYISIENGATLSELDSNIIISNSDGSISVDQAIKVTSGTYEPIYGDMTDSRDGKSYKTVQIGDQEWMAENLDYTGSIPLSVDWEMLSYTDQAYCYCNNDMSLGYGCLYTWAAAMNGSDSSSSNPSDIRGVCPSGWHLPSDTEWQELEDYLNNNITISDGNVAKSMSSKTGWSSYSGTSSTNNNSSGFSALPGGWRTNHMGKFYSAGYSGYWWTSTSALSYSAYTRRISSSSQNIVREVDGGIRDGGFSVRCLKD